MSFRHIEVLPGSVSVPSPLGGTFEYERFFNGHPDVVAPDGTTLSQRFGHAYGDIWRPFGVLTGNVTNVAVFVKHWAAALGGTLRWRAVRDRDFGERPLNEVIDVVRRIGARSTLAGRIFRRDVLPLYEDAHVIIRGGEENFSLPTDDRVTAALMYKRKLPWAVQFLPLMMPDNFENVWWNTLGDGLGRIDEVREYAFDVNADTFAIAGGLRALGNYAGLAPVRGEVRLNDETKRPEHRVAGLFRPVGQLSPVPLQGGALMGAASVKVAGKAMWDGGLKLELTPTGHSGFELYALHGSLIDGDDGLRGIRWSARSGKGWKLPSDAALNELLRALFVGDQEYAGPDDPSDAARGKGAAKSPIGGIVAVDGGTPETTTGGGSSAMMQAQDQGAPTMLNVLGATASIFSGGAGGFFAAPPALAPVPV